MQPWIVLAERLEGSRYVGCLKLNETQDIEENNFGNHTTGSVF